MVKDFLEYFNKPYEIESKMKTPDGNKASFFKAYLDGCTFIVYATIVDGRPGRFGVSPYNAV